MLKNQRSPDLNKWVDWVTIECTSFCTSIYHPKNRRGSNSRLIWKWREINLTPVKSHTVISYRTSKKIIIKIAIKKFIFINCTIFSNSKYKSRAQGRHKWKFSRHPVPIGTQIFKISRRPLLEQLRVSTEKSLVLTSVNFLAYLSRVFF